MTNDEFRTMALKIAEAVERSHMNHPDFPGSRKDFRVARCARQKLGHGETYARATAHIHRKGARGFQALQRRLGPARVHECLPSLRENEHCSRCSRGGGKERRIKEEENAQRATSNAQRSMIQAEAFHSRYRAL